MEKNVKNSFANKVMLYAKYFISNCKYMETYSAADKKVTFLKKNNAFCSLILCNTGVGN